VIVVDVSQPITDTDPSPVGQFKLFAILHSAIVTPATDKLAPPPAQHIPSRPRLLKSGRTQRSESSRTTCLKESATGEKINSGRRIHCASGRFHETRESGYAGGAEGWTTGT
jgi:hypothetical protein